MRGLRQLERVREIGERTRLRGLLHLLMGSECFEVLLGILLHEPQIVAARPALRLQDANALTFDR